MSDELATLANRAKSAFKRTRTSRTEWIAATLELAATLCQARERLPNNDAFGIWLGQAGLETLSKDDRAALINIGAHEEDAREVFAEYDGLSWRMAWQEIQRLRSLRTRETEQTVDQAMTIVNQTRPVFLPQPTNVVALRQPANPTKEAIPPPLRTEPQPEGRATESYFANVISCFIYGAQFWRTSDELARLVNYWAKGRGDGVPAASKIRDLARWLDSFAEAIETYRPKSRRSGGST